MHYRPVWPILEDIVADPDLAKGFALYPEQRFVRRSEDDATPMRTWEELHHGDDWWYLQVLTFVYSLSRLLTPFQDQIPDGDCILFLVVYMDETNVSIIGGVRVWPVYVWVGNLPAATRKQRNKKGGAVLLGYLPEVCLKCLRAYWI